MRDSRQDEATARAIDIALVLRKLRGMDAAKDYLRSAHVAEELIARTLTTDAIRASMTAPSRSPDPDTGPVPGSPKATPFYQTTGRRHDVVRAALVQVAIALNGRQLAGRAEEILRREALSDDVIARVLGQDDSRRRMP
ncbi:hypothetical protein [Pseudoduganella umbonata]|uniref:Uncharacterized protein n=1 Tax=Pseudoduganella umbonata TaxID=864828 RepID=A0A4P8HPB3_9BURK|nr:hypothetical protein [Pseudoduganella umbonata]MBB3221110.1 hypothetical protein [Pseudoduganella umbonata]QCP10304.1 hypothetical protein FCL38_07595 [Pseudoduganella umbonata]